MPKIIYFLVLLPFFALGQDLTTVFESSNGRYTGDYETVIDYYTRLDSLYEEIQTLEMGLTDSGLPLHLVTLDIKKEFDFNEIYKSGRTIVLINNGIHPGEPDGIEACQMLLRDYLQDKSKHELLENVVIAVIPIYNIGGALNRNSFSRVNQFGPEEYGFRGNSRNFDLNRDFIKSDTRNTRSFHQLFQKVNPDIFIDTHVSNGADYQYTITHLMTQHNKLGGELGKYLEQDFTPMVEEKMAARNTEITPYVNVFNSLPDAGFSQFLDNPRYSTGYAALFNTLGLMIETHMLKPFDVRVQSTYNLLEVVLEIAQSDGKEIRKLKKERQKEITAGTTHPVGWRLTRSESKTIEFKGYSGQEIKSDVTGQQRLVYDANWPYTKSIPYYNVFVPTDEVVVPKAYIIPQGWHDVISILLGNNVSYKQFEQDTLLNLEVYSIEKVTPSKSVYEGHYPNKDVKLTMKQEEVTLRKGDYIFYVDERAGRFLVETLEPQATDSFFAWNFFDTILQQKEGFFPLCI